MIFHCQWTILLLSSSCGISVYSQAVVGLTKDSGITNPDMDIDHDPSFDQAPKTSLSCQEDHFIIVCGNMSIMLLIVMLSMYK